MINTVADFLHALIEKEKAILAKQPELNHAPMLGDMYEGLARQILNKAIFKGLNLRVVEGKIEDSQGNLSGQIDCMIVEGDGRRLPHTDHYIYHYSKAIAAIEVKKTLYGSGLADSFLHLRDIKDSNFAPDEKRLSLLRDAWRSLMKRSFPSADEVAGLLPEEKIIRSVLISEAHRPLRIVLGYDGYKSEHELRMGLIRFLENNVAPATNPRRVFGFGINSFPNQIICSEASIFKLDGMPFAVPISPDGFWPFLASQTGKPLHTLLELIWTRLAYMYKLSPEIFGEDLDCEVANKFLEARWLSQGWEMRYVNFSGNQLSEGPRSIEWQPEILTLAEFVVVNKLCGDGEIRLDDQNLTNWLKEQGTTPTRLAASLNEKGLVFVKSDKMHLLTDECSCAILPDGRFVAGENRTGRLIRWVNRCIERQKVASQQVS